MSFGEDVVATIDIRARDGAGPVLAKVAAEAKAAGREFETTGKSGSKMGSSIGSGVASAAVTMAKFGAGVAIAGAAAAAFAVKSAADFETAGAHIEAFASTSHAQVEQWKSQVLSMAPAMGQSATAMMNSLYNIASAGVTGKDAMTALRVATMSATASQSDMSVATGILTAAMNAYHLHGAKEVIAAQDDITQAVNLGKMEMADYSTALANVIPVASHMGVSLKSLGAMFAVLTNQGISTAESGDLIRNALQQMDAPTHKQIEAAKALGFNWRDLTVKGGDVEGALHRIDAMMHSTAPTWQDIQNRTGATTKRAKELADMFKQTDERARALFGGNQTAARAFLALMNDGGKQVHTDLIRMANDAGVTKQAFVVMQNTTQGAWNRLTGSIQAAAIAIGTKLLPPVAQAVSGLAKWTVGATKTGGAISNLTNFLFGHDKTVRTVAGSYDHLSGQVVPHVITSTVHVKGVLQQLGDALNVHNAKTNTAASGTQHWGNALKNVGDIFGTLTPKVDENGKKTNDAGAYWNDAGKKAEFVTKSLSDNAKQYGTVGNAIDRFNNGPMLGLRTGSFNAFNAWNKLLSDGIDKGAAGFHLAGNGVQWLRDRLAQELQPATASAAGVMRHFGTDLQSTQTHAQRLRDVVNQMHDPIQKAGTSSQTAAPHVKAFGTAAQQSVPHLTKVASEANTAASQITQAGQHVQTASQHITTSLQHMSSSGTQALSQMASRMGQAMTQVGQRMSQAISQASNQVVNHIRQMAAQAQAAVQQMTSQIVAQMHQMAAQMAAAGVQGGTQFAAGIRAGMAQAVAAASAAVAQIQGILMSAVGMASAAGAATGAAFAAGIASQVGAVAAAAQALASAAAGSLERHSPPKDAPWFDTLKFGIQNGLAFAKGLASTAPAVGAAAAMLAGAASGPLTAHAAYGGGSLGGAGTQHAALSSNTHAFAPSATGASKEYADLLAALKQLPVEMQQYMKPVLDDFRAQLAKEHADYIQKIHKENADYAAKIKAENDKYADKLSRDQAKHAEDVRHYLADHHIKVSASAQQYLDHLHGLNQKLAEAEAEHNWKLAGSLAMHIQQYEDANKKAAAEVNQINNEHLKHQQITYDQHRAAAEADHNARLAKLAAEHRKHAADLKAAFDGHVKSIKKAMEAAASPAARFDQLTQQVNTFVDSTMKTLALAILDGTGNLNKLTAAAAKAVVAQNRLTQVQADAALRIAKATNDFAGQQSYYQKQASDAANLVAMKMYDLAHGITDTLPPLDQLIANAQKAATRSDEYANSVAAANTAIATFPPRMVAIKAASVTTAQSIHEISPAAQSATAALTVLASGTNRMASTLLTGRTGFAAFTKSLATATAAVTRQAQLDAKPAQNLGAQFDALRQQIADKLQQALSTAAAEFKATGQVSAATALQLQQLQAAVDSYDAAVKAAEDAAKGTTKSFDDLSAAASDTAKKAFAALEEAIFSGQTDINGLARAAADAQVAADKFTEAEKKATLATLQQVAALEGTYSATVNAAKASYDYALTQYENAVVAGVTGDALAGLKQAAINAGLALAKLEAIPGEIEAAISKQSQTNSLLAAAGGGTPGIYTGATRSDGTVTQTGYIATIVPGLYYINSLPDGTAVYYDQTTGAYFTGEKYKQGQVPNLTGNYDPATQINAAAGNVGNIDNTGATPGTSGGAGIPGGVVGTGGGSVTATGAPYPIPPYVDPYGGNYGVYGYNPDQVTYDQSATYDNQGTASNPTVVTLAPGDSQIQQEQLDALQKQVDALNAQLALSKLATDAAMDVIRANNAGNETGYFTARQKLSNAMISNQGR